MTNSPDWLPLQMRNIEFGYEENPLFTDFSLSVTQKGCYQILSSGHINASLYLLRLLAGLTKPRQGECFSGEVCLSKLSFEEFLPWTKQMGYAFETWGLLSNKTVYENLLLPLQYHQRASMDECQKKVEVLIEELGLSTCKGFRPADLARSDYKMAVLARSIIHNPKMLLLAAPEEGLEPDRFDKFTQLVGESLRSGVMEAVLYSSASTLSFGETPHFQIQLEPHQAHLIPLRGAA